MPKVRAPSGGNIFTDISRAGGGFIAGSLQRQQRQREEARQAALDKDKFESSAVSRALSEAQTGLAGAQTTELEARPQRLQDEKDLLRENRLQTATDVLATTDLTPEQQRTFANHFAEHKAFPPGTDLTPSVDRQPDVLEQLGFKADVKRKFLITLSGDNVLELTNQDLISQADSEIRRLVQTNPGADFELIQSTVIDELEKALKTLEQKKKASQQQGATPFPVEFNREEQVFNQFSGSR